MIENPEMLFVSIYLGVGLFIWLVVFGISQLMGPEEMKQRIRKNLEDEVPSSMIDIMIGISQSPEFKVKTFFYLVFLWPGILGKR